MEFFFYAIILRGVEIKHENLSQRPAESINIRNISLEVGNITLVFS
jgi:hypothetical protein